MHQIATAPMVTERLSPRRESDSVTQRMESRVAFRCADQEESQDAPMKKTTSTAKKEPEGISPSEEIDAQLRELGDWRDEMLARVRAIILKADPGIIEEVKWRKPSNGMRGVPVWSKGGIICTGETYRKAVKLTFAKGASLPDPTGLFNASLDGNTRRAIDLNEGDKVNEKALKDLVRAAAALNTAGEGKVLVRAAKKPRRV